MAKGEKLHLLLVTKDEKKPEGLKTQLRNCCWRIILIQLCILFIFFSFLVFIALKVGEIETTLKDKNENVPNGTIPGSDFCKSVNTENMTLVALGHLTGVKEKNSLEAKNKIYYLTNRWFTDQEACAVEAVLRLLQDKSIFIIEIGNITNSNSSVDFIQFLREHYTNLNRIKSNPNTFFKGSPFLRYIKAVDDFSMFAAKVLLVWQFGGTVMSPELLLLNRRIYDHNEGFCEVDKNLLFCPNQCSAYIYQLIKTIRDILRSQQDEQNKKEILLHIVDTSVNAYCGDEKAAPIGCIGVNRIKKRKICSKISEYCDFLKVQEWKTNDKNWKKTIQKFCPKIATKYVTERE